MKITASIVLYHSSFEIISDLINKILNYNNSIFIFLIDNSSKDNLKTLQVSDRIKYIFLNKNIGFGAAHNIAINKSIDFGSSYHFVINPDIILKNDVINPLIDFLRINKNVGLVMPRISNVDGSFQFLPKLIASPLSIIKRKLHVFLNLDSKFLDTYELRFYKGNDVIEIPVISGCFMILKLEIVEKVGFFDENFFMYFEDWDLSRRINKFYKTIYIPSVEVFHKYESGANKNINLFFIYLHSGIKYFNKWGWFFDKTRNEINKKTLNQFR